MSRFALVVAISLGVILGGNAVANAGSVTFSILAQVPLASEATLLSAVDFTGDGVSDAVLFLPGASTLSLYPGNGSGFQAPIPVAVSGTPISVATGDLNEDGLIDLVVGENGGLVEVFGPDGLGGYVLLDSVSTGSGAPAVVLAQLDDDDHLDLAVAVNALMIPGGGVAVYQGTGLGTFPIASGFSAANEVTALLAEDFDGDSDIDLMVGISPFAGFSSVDLHLNDGLGNFGTGSTAATGFGGTFAAADFNNDGLMDFATSVFNFFCFNNVEVYLNQPSGGFVFTQALPTACGPYRVLADDFDDDGNMDVVYSDGGDFVPAVNGIPIGLGDGTGAFTLCPFAPTAALSLSSPLVGRFDGDDLPDLLATSIFITDLIVYRNDTVVVSTFERGDANADGLFNIADAIFSLTSLFVGGSPAPTCLDAADANDDGAFDVADAVFSLSSLFVSGSPSPPAPFGACGIDPTSGDPLGCGAFAACP
ncbi:MAG: FG-GAP repeat domain-containing protein [Planctomycetota bacterium]